MRTKRVPQIAWEILGYVTCVWLIVGLTLVATHGASMMSCGR